LEIETIRWIVSAASSKTGGFLNFAEQNANESPAGHQTLKTLRFRGFLLYPVKIKTPCLFVHFTKGRVSVFDVQKTII
jgi:hypothetical protein